MALFCPQLGHGVAEVAIAVSVHISVLDLVGSTTALDRDGLRPALEEPVEQRDGVAEVSITVTVRISVLDRDGLFTGANNWKLRPAA